MAFTIVFEGDIRSVKGNPMTLETPFGKVKASGYGDAFAQQDVLEDALNEIASSRLNIEQARDRAELALDEVNSLMVSEAAK